MTNFYRVSTANMYDSTLRNLAARQKQLVDLQENLTSGKRVVRPSDDPVAAAQAERALTRISRIQTEQRQLEVQRDSIALGESALGDAIGVIQEMRQLVVAAGNGSLKAEDRKTYANQLQSLREQFTEVINRKDTNGAPLLGALGSALQAFAGPLLAGGADYQFDGLPGQGASQGNTITTTLDGHAALMFDPRRDGVYAATLGNAAATPLAGRHLSTGTIDVANKSQIALDANGNAFGYSVSFGTPTVHADGSYDIDYQVTRSDGTPMGGTQTVTGLKPDELSNIAVSFTDPDPGGAVFSLNIEAKPGKNADGSTAPSPANGDTVQIAASPSLMSTLDAAIAGIAGAADSAAANQVVGQALANIDKGLERLHNMRGFAGELLNRADRVGDDQGKRAIQLEADRSRAEDLDMVQGISDFQNANVGYQAALQSYAQVQRLSLFNFIN